LRPELQNPCSDDGKSTGAGDGHAFEGLDNSYTVPSQAMKGALLATGAEDPQVFLSF